MKCPKCGEELPILSKICPVCKTVVDKQDGAPEAIALSGAIDEVTLSIQQLVPQAGSLRLGRQVWLYILISGVFLGALAAKTGAGILWILAIAAIVIAFVLLRRRPDTGDLSRVLADKKINFEYGKELVGRFYSGNREMMRFADESSRKVAEAETAVKAGVARGRLFGLGLAAAEAVVLLVALLAVPSRAEMAKRAEEKAAAAQLAVPDDYDGKISYYIQAGDPEKAIQTYLRSEYNNEYLGADKREELTRQLCQEGYADDAAAFVKEHCVGQMKDFDCAAIVTKAYLRADRQKAATFVGSITGLRYKSDIEKLKALL